MARLAKSEITCHRRSGGRSAELSENEEWMSAVLASSYQAHKALLAALEQRRANEVGAAVVGAPV